MDLRALVPNGAVILVKDERNTIVQESSPGFWGPVVPGSFVFVSHRYVIDPDKVVAVPGLLHGAALEMSTKLIEAAVVYLKPGGKVFDKSTVGMTHKKLVETVVDPAISQLVGGAKRHHDYTTGSAKLPVTLRWGGLFGEITPSLFLPLMDLWAQYLIARQTLDRTLCNDLNRYNSYHLLSVVAPLVVLSELAELKRREAKSKAFAQTYVNAHSDGGANADISLPITILQESLLNPDTSKMMDALETAIDNQAPSATVDALASQVDKVAKKDKKNRQLTSMKLSAVACAFPLVLSRLNKLLGSRLLMAWVAEDGHEYDLKGIKRAV